MIRGYSGVDQLIKTSQNANDCLYKFKSLIPVFRIYIDLTPRHLSILNIFPPPNMFL